MFGLRSGPSWGLAWLLALSGFVGVSCSSPLLQKAKPLNIRYFAPYERSMSAAPAALRAHTELPPLRIGRVSGSPHLDVRLVSRERNELIFHDTLRWSERPEYYLDQGLRHALYEERGLVPAVSGRAWTLNATLRAFEQAGDQARVSVEWLLHDEVRPLAHATTLVERPVGAEPRPEILVDALSDALAEAIEKIADQVTTALADLPE